MKKLQELDLCTFIQTYQKPFLGICLGMQVMCAHTKEGNTNCLNIIPVQVKKFPPHDIIPHTGWNEVIHQENYGRVPALRFGSGYTLQVLTCYASCGLSAAIPHAKNKVKKFVWFIR
jgi:imidazoleglycerol phosphate synthase glutamine amidotransferase subunit HisH